MNAVSAARERSDSDRRSTGAAGSSNHRLRWASLVERIARGDRDALATLYDESSSLAFGLIRHILPDGSAAEDALVDTYVQVRDQARSLAGDRDAVSWLLSVARRAALARRPERDRKGDANAYPALPSAAVASVRPFEPGHREKQHVTSALDRLSTRQRAIVQMTYFGGLNVNEVARELQLERDEVLHEIRRAMSLVRGALAWVQAD
jgi:RNA polymerase sigma-70 factor, ECF subfamily